MIDKLAERPEVFKRSEQGDVYYMLSDDNGPYAYITLNCTYPPVAILHLEVKRFTHNILKSGIALDWCDVRNACRGFDCDIIHIQKEGGFAKNDKWMKLVRHFGFKDFTQFTASVQCIGDKNGKTRA